MDKIINILITILLLGSCIFNVILVSDLNKRTTELIELTHLEPEIIFLDSLVYDTVYIEKYENVRLPIYNTDTILINDTILITDSADVVIPISTYHYDTTLAETHISLICEGFDVRLNSLLIENLKTSIIKENKPKRIGLGLQLGIGATKEGFSPYIGVGISYNLFSF